MSLHVVAIVAAHNEADVILPVVRALVDEGVEVCLVDHASTDGTADVVRPLLGHGVVRIERFPDESGFPAEDAGVYAWEHLLRRKEALARELPADWFIHHDADEFREGPWPEVGLVESIARVDRLGYDAIDFEVLNFPPTHDDFRPGDDPREAFGFYEPGPPRDKVQVRAWKNTGRPVDLASSGGHEARFEGRRVFPIRFLLRHYPVRGQAHGERKVLVERRPRFLDAERARGWHVQYEGVEPGRSFLRRPEELVAWDPLQARLRLWVRHRELEAVEGERARVGRELERAERDAANYRRDLGWHMDEVARLGRELDERQRELPLARARVDMLAREANVLHEALDESQRRALSLSERLDRAQREAAAMHEVLDAARREGVDLHGRLDRALREIPDLHARLDRALAEASAARDRVDALAERLRRAEEELAVAEAESRVARQQLAAVLVSRTWRYTAPLRKLLDGGA